MLQLSQNFNDNSEYSQLIDPGRIFTPFVFRRAVTSLGEFPPLTSSSSTISSRSKSARYDTNRDSSSSSSSNNNNNREQQFPIMPRSHVSVARFYDWSEQFNVGDRLSVSRLYREIASIPKSQGSKSRVNLSLAYSGVDCSPGLLSRGGGGLVPCGGGGSINSPRRMFVRDKKTLTRGEREIVEGIYKNRSDLNGKDAATLAKFGDYDAKSHADAWLTGKSVVKAERLDGGKQHNIHKWHNQDSRILIKSCGSSGLSGGDSAVVADTTLNNLAYARISGIGYNDAAIATAKQTTTTTPPTTTTNWGTTSNGNSNSSNNRTTSNHRKFPDLSPRVNVSCSKCQREFAAIHGSLAKRAMETQSQDGYWDVRPGAPPSTPDQQQHANSNNNNNKISITTTNNNSNNNNNKISITTTNNTNNDDNNVTSRTRHHAPQSPPFPVPRVSFDNGNKRQSTVNIHQPNTTPAYASTTTTTSSSSTLTQSPPPSSPQTKDVFANSENRVKSQSDSTKVTVKVYLPVADGEDEDEEEEEYDDQEDEEEIKSMTSSTKRKTTVYHQTLCKERPLCHADFVYRKTSSTPRSAIIQKQTDITS